MLGTLRSVFDGGGGGNPAATSRLPAELVAAICAASITFRPSTDADGSARVSVILPTVGTFAFDGIREAAERIARAWPEISPAQARHAAHLLAGQIANANRMHALGRAPRRRGWVHDYMPPDLEDFAR